jgi:hypothetical protein
MKRFLYLIRYIKLLNKNKKTLSDSRINNNPNPLGIQFDWIFRLYTVLNLPFDDKENMDKYGYYYIDNMVKNHVSEINNFLFELGILEYVELDTDNIIQIDDNNIRIVLKFKYLNIKLLARILIVSLFAILIGGITSIFYFV